jgi:hypothetical protein
MRIAFIAFLAMASHVNAQEVLKTTLPNEAASRATDEVSAIAPDLRRMLQFVPPDMEFFIAFRGGMPAVPKATSGVVEFLSNGPVPRDRGELPDEKALALSTAFDANVEMFESVTTDTDWKREVQVSVNAGKSLVSAEDFGEVTTFKGCNIVSIRGLASLPSLSKLLSDAKPIQDATGRRIVEVKAVRGDDRGTFYVERLADDVIAISNDLAIATMLDDMAQAKRAGKPTRKSAMDDLPPWVEISADAIFAAVRIAKPGDAPDPTVLDKDCRGLQVTSNGKAPAMQLRYRSDATDPAAMLRQGLAEVLGFEGIAVVAGSDRGVCTAKLPFDRVQDPVNGGDVDIDPLFTTYYLIGFVTFL